MNIDVLKDLSPAEPASAGDLPPFGLFAAGVYPFLEFRWFHEAYYRVLEAFAAGRVRRLIVTMPPQHGKSVGASTLLPAYLLGRNPDLRIAIASYSASLASKFNRRVQRIIDSPEYAAFFPETTIKRGARPPEYLRTADEVEIIGHRGGLLSVGREGALTGNRVDCFILDDLYMLEHFFPELRNSVSTVLYLHIVTQDSETEPEPIAVVPSEEERAPQQEPVRVPADAASMPCETTISATVPAKPRRSYPANMIGVHAGYCTSWITSYGLTSSTRPGYEVGVSDRIRLGRQFPFYLRTGLTFISKGYEVRGFDDSRTTMNYLQIPVGIDYTVALGERFALIPHAGFYYAVGVGGKRKVGAEEIPVFGEKGGFSRHDMGFSCGADITFGRFGIGVAYQIGLINIDKTDTMYGNDSQMVGYKNVRNRSFIVRAGVNF